MSSEHQIFYSFLGFRSLTIFQTLGLTDQMACQELRSSFFFFNVHIVMETKKGIVPLVSLVVNRYTPGTTSYPCERYQRNFMGVFIIILSFFTLIISVVIDPESPRAGHLESTTGSFGFQDPMAYMAAGMRAVVQDCVNQSFTSAELRTWNMLSR